MRPTDDDTLRATIDALAAAGGNVTAAAEALGVNRSTVYSRLTRAAQRGLDGSVPRPLPPGQTIRGVSTLYDRNGEVAATWVKTRTDLAADRDAWLDAAREALADYRGAVAPVEAPVDFDPDSLVLHGFADLHFGLYAWAAETGAAYDLEIADRLLARPARSWRKPRRRTRPSPCSSATRLTPTTPRPGPRRAGIPSMWTRATKR